MFRIACWFTLVIAPVCLSLPTLAAEIRQSTASAARTSPSDAAIAQQVFARMLGRWNTAMKIWNSATPNAPPVESTGVSESKTVLRGRFVLEEAQESLLGMPMQRMSVLGYDSVARQYTQVFYSSMDSTTHIALGTFDDATQTLTLRGTFKEPGGPVPFKNVIRLDNDDEHHFASYRILPDGSEVKVIEQVSTRVR
jgi:hypothetical protein